MRANNQRRRGRPPYPSDQLRGNRAVTFLTDREMAKLKRLADSEGATLSGACYRILREHLK